MSDTQDVPGIVFERLIPWFSEHVEPVPSLSAKVVGHGRSNITYRLEAGDKAWVLRRPPLGHVLPTAHDMVREYRVMTALRKPGAESGRKSRIYQKFHEASATRFESLSRAAYARAASRSSRSRSS